MPGKAPAVGDGTVLRALGSPAVAASRGRTEGPLPANRGNHHPSRGHNASVCGRHDESGLAGGRQFRLG